jgi:hypothetical protein
VEGLAAAVGRVDEALAKAESDRRKAAKDYGDRLGTLGGRVDALGTRMDTLAATVDGLTEQITTVYEETRRQGEQQDAFFEQQRRDTNRRLAGDELDRLEGQWLREFGVRDRVRDQARKLVSLLVSGATGRELLDDDRLERIAGSRELQESDHWLAYAVLAVTARLRGEHDRARTAGIRAGREDAAGAALFAALTAALCPDLDRSAVGAQLDEYFGQIRPDRLGPEFADVLNAVAEYELGAEARRFAVEHLTRWVSAAAPAAVESCERRLRQQLPAPQAGRYPALQGAYTGNWAELARGWAEAGVADAVRERRRAAFPVAAKPAQGGAGLVVKGRSGQVAAALGRLVGRTEEDETTLRTAMELRHRIREFGGDLVAAEAEHERRLTAGPGVTDFAALIDAVGSGLAGTGLGDDARLLLADLGADRFGDAVRNIAVASRSRRPDRIGIAVDGWTATLSTDPADAPDADVLASGLGTHLAAAVDSAMAKAARMRPHLIAVGASGVATLCVALAALGGTARVLLLVAGLLAVLWAVVSLVGVLTTQNQVRDKGERGQGESRVRLTAVLGEHKAFFARWEEQLAAVGDAG